MSSPGAAALKAAPCQALCRDSLCAACWAQRALWEDGLPSKSRIKTPANSPLSPPPPPARQHLPTQAWMLRCPAPGPGLLVAAMWARSLLARTLARRLARPRQRASIRMASTLPRLPLFAAIHAHDARRTAVVHSLSGRAFTYGELLNDVAAAKLRLQQHTGGHSAAGQRIAFLVENGYDYVGAHSPTPPRRAPPPLRTRN